MADTTSNKRPAAKKTAAPKADPPTTTVGEIDEKSKPTRDTKVESSPGRTHAQRNKDNEGTKAAKAPLQARSEASTVRPDAERTEEVQVTVHTLANGKTEATTNNLRRLVDVDPRNGDATPSGSPGLNVGDVVATHPSAQSGISAPPGGEDVQCYGCLQHYNPLDGDVQRAHGTHKASRDMSQNTLVKWVTDLQAERDRLIKLAHKAND